MKFFVPLMLTLTLFISSCSSTYTQRDRSVANDVESPLTAEELFTVKSTTKIEPGLDATAEILQSLKSGTKMDVEYVVDPKMSSEYAFKLVPTIENQKYKIKILASANAAHDLGATYELKLLVAQFLPEVGGNFMSIYSLFELFYNAQANDFPSLYVMAKLRLANAVLGKDELPENLKYWTEVNEKFAVQERIFNKKKKVKTEARKAVMDVLDKVSDDKQFRNLVAKNDRKGAADLLRAYLPWEEMPPFEKLFWETHLKVMVDPLPLEDRVMIYRGIDDDVIQMAQEGEKTLTKEEAIKEQKIFLMSTMMTKNQGTWNRRLRSLTAMYEKFMGTNLKNSSEFTSATRITNMFRRHSVDPKGSPFLSYTPKYEVSFTFGYSKNTAYFLDPRLLYFNMTSGYANEVEFLLPIASFPDDLAVVYDKSIHGPQQDMKGFFKAQAIARLERDLGAGKGEEAYKRISSNSEKFFAPVIGATGKVVATPPPAIDGKFTSFFKKLMGMPTAQVADVIDDKSNMACTDLIQLFWK